MKLKLLAIFLFVSVLGFAQTGARFGDGQPTQTTRKLAGQSATFVVTLGGSRLNICGATPNGAPCTNFATTYTDATLTTPCATNTQVVLSNTSSCVANSDAQGMWGAWLTPGNYSYTFTSTTGATFGPYQFTAGGNGSGSGSSLTVAIGAAPGQTVQFVNGTTIQGVINGVPGFARSGTTDTIVCDTGSVANDRLHTIEYTSASAVAVTLPSPGTAGCGNNFAVRLVARTGTVTVTPAGGATITYYGIGPTPVVAASSLPMVTGVSCFINSPDNAKWLATCNGKALDLSALTQGQPVSVNGSQALTQSAANYDVKAAGLAGDMCQQIALAFAAAPNSTIDARGFTGDQACSVNMFGATDPAGLLLLGSVVIHVQVPQVRPSRMIARGIGWKVSTTDANTVFRACSGGTTGIDATCGGVTLANATNVARPTIVCSGKAGVCGANTTFGNRFEYVTFDGNGLANVTLDQDYISQESSGCQYCNFLYYGNSGIGLDVGGGGPKSQNASFDHLYFAIPNVGGAVSVCTNAAVPIVVNTGGAGNPGPRRVSDVTIDNHGCNYAGGAAGVAPFPIDDVQLSGTSVHLEDIHGEYAAVLLRVSGSATSNTLVVNDISSANMQTTAGSHAVCNGLDTQTSTFTVILDSANTYQNINTFGMKANSPGTATYVMNDCAAGVNGLITSGSGESNGLAFYVIGPSGKNVNLNSAAASVASMPGFTWGVDTMTSNAAAPVPNCQAGNVHRESTNVNIIPAAPTGCLDGQTLMFEVSTAGVNTTTFSNAAYIGGVLMTGAAGKRCTEEFTYSLATSKAYFVSGGTCN